MDDYLHHMILCRCNYLSRPLNHCWYSYIAQTNERPVLTYTFCSVRIMFDMCTVQIIHDTYPIYRPFGDYSGEFKVWTMFDFCTCLLYWISGHISIFMIPKTLDRLTTKWPYSSCPVYVQCARPFVNICFVVYDFQIYMNTTNLPSYASGD